MASFHYKAAQIGKFQTKDSDSALDGFGKSCRIMGLTMGRFSMIDLIHSILKRTGPAHVICTTWSAGIKDAHQVRWMMDSDLIRSFQLITDHSFATRKGQYVLPITDLFGADSIRTSEIHAKFTLIHNEEFQVTVRTSMNLNANKTCESFEIDEDSAIFAFYMGFVEHTFGDMPKGFTAESFRVAASLIKYFNTDQAEQSGQTKAKWWSNL